MTLDCTVVTMKVLDEATSAVYVQPGQQEGMSTDGCL